MRIDKDRIAHMHGCAEYMYRHAEEYRQDPDEMYLLGLVHDIGYVNGKKGHEAYGANIRGLSNRLSYVIRLHGTTPQEYISDHSGWPLMIPPELILLWEADMHIDGKGNEVTYEERLAEMAAIYGIESEPFRVCEDTIEWLMAREAAARAANSVTE